MAGSPDSPYNIYDLGFGKDLIRSKVDDPEIQAPDDTVSQDVLSGSSSDAGGSFSGGLFNPVSGLTPPESISSGELPALIGHGKKKFTDTVAGFLMGIDTDNIYKWIIGDSGSSIDWAVTTPNTLTLSGGVLAIVAGTIAGMTISATSLTAVSGGNTTIVSSGATAFASGPTGSPTFSVTQAGLLTTISALIGGFSVGTDYFRDVANSFGLASTITGGDDVRFWAGDTFANRAIAPASITESGIATFSNIKITGLRSGSSLDGQYMLALSIGSAAANLALQSWSQTCAFSVTDLDTVAWGAGSFVLADGTTYAIGAGNTGNMAARTYIYLDINVSTTAYQTTTTAATAVGNGKKLVASAINGAVEPTFTVFGGVGGLNIDASSIVANSITANEIAANTITGGNILTLNISGKNATFDTGTIAAFTIAATTISATNLTITSGAANTANISVGTGANLSGLNSGNSGTDIAGWAGATFANRATAPLRWNLQGDFVATSATISGYVVRDLKVFGGDGSDGALSTSSGTTNFDLGGVAVFVKNYTSISITGTANITFSNPHANGTVIVWKSQGNVTMTSSAGTMIDLTNLGAVGGAAGAAGAAGGNGNNGSGLIVSPSKGFGATITAVGNGGRSLLISSMHYGKAVPCFSGSGGGGGNASNSSSANGAGSAGAGGLYIECGGALNTTGSIVATGTAGVAGSSTGGANHTAYGGGGGGASVSDGANGTITTGSNIGGGGGGGGGGGVAIIYTSLTANSSTITVTGGAGGSPGGGAGATGFSEVAKNTEFV